MGILNSLFGKKPPPRTVLAEHEDFVICWSPTHSLEAWASYRLPYDPQTEGEIRLRSELQKGLDSPAMAPPSRLMCRHAIYACAVREMVDVENVTCYNISRWPSVSAAYSAIRIERLPKTTETPPPQMRAKAQHYWRYFLEPLDASFLGWRTDRKDAVEIHAKGIAVDDLSSRAHVWHAVKKAMQQDLSRWWGWSRIGANDFAMHVRVSLPENAWGRRAVQVKPLLDGIVAAFHSQTNPSSDLVSRISHNIGASPVEVGGLLAASRGAVLGQHQVFILRADDFMVSPRDDLCAAVEVRLGPTTEASASVAFCAFEARPAS